MSTFRKQEGWRCRNPFYFLLRWQLCDIEASLCLLTECISWLRKESGTSRCYVLRAYAENWIQVFRLSEFNWYVLVSYALKTTLKLDEFSAAKVWYFRPGRSRPAADHLERFRSVLLVFPLIHRIHLYSSNFWFRYHDEDSSNKCITIRRFHKLLRLSRRLGTWERINATLKNFVLWRIVARRSSTEFLSPDEFDNKIELLHIDALLEAAGTYSSVFFITFPRTSVSCSATPSQLRNWTFQVHALKS